ncbi:hypothetical protein OSB04_un001067 [Centaurea solstitialis]|uniref:CCHC-type domain-containing protein n=1 Tax=Centaurea solstitialis TaxID=347529 RepID=A0AA38S516_9ASTR|nr:hypothetical protein OSB04_un001067 [Centaurea solstitialis]
MLEKQSMKEIRKFDQVFSGNVVSPIKKIIMSHETDPSEYQSHGSPEHPRSGNSVPRDPYSDSDADSHRPIPAPRPGLRVRATARKSVPLPTRMTFRVPVGDGAGPSRVRGRGGSSSSSSSSTSASPPPYRPSSSVPPAARPPPVARPSPVPRPPHMARAPVLCLRGMTPTERQEVARLARGQDIHEHLLDHHDHMIDSLLGVAGADSQQLSRIVALLSHTMASLHHLYTVVYLVVTVVVLLLLWAVWREDPELARLVLEQVLASLPDIISQVATRLTNNAIRPGTFSNDKAKGKRKMEKSTKPQFKGRSSKNRRVTKNYGIRTQVAEKEEGTYPKCDKCGNHHTGRCIICRKCGKGGHVDQDCRRRTCYECGSPNHYRKACPKANKRPYANQAQPASQGNRGGMARGRAFVSGAEEARQNPDVVTGTFLLNNYPAIVLFEFGADRSYVSLEFWPKLNKKSQNLKEEHLIEYSNGELVKASKVVKKCTLGLAEKGL